MKNSPRKIERAFNTTEAVMINLFCKLFSVGPAYIDLFSVNVVCRLFTMSRSFPAPNLYFLNKYKSFDSPETVDDFVEFLKKRAGEVAEVVLKNQGTNLADCSDGPYAGVAGPAYMCFYLSRLQEFSHKKDDLLAKAVEYIDAAVCYSKYDPVSQNQ